MAWTKSSGTKHTCNDGDGPHFGRKTAGCQRCDELTQGAKPRQWSSAKQWNTRNSSSARAVHNCTASNCNPLCCTYGDW